MREITSVYDSSGHRVFQVNHKNILIRGGGWATDLFFRTSEQRYRYEFQYMLHMGLNTVRVRAVLPVCVSHAVIIPVVLLVAEVC